MTATVNRWSVELYNNFGEFWNIYTVLAPTKERAEAKALTEHSHLNGGGWKICSCKAL